MSAQGHHLGRIPLNLFLISLLILTMLQNMRLMTKLKLENSDVRQYLTSPTESHINLHNAVSMPR